MLIKKTHESLCIEYKVNHQSKYIVIINELVLILLN